MDAHLTGKSTRKCPGCGSWSVWQQQPTDTCQYCAQPLDPIAASRLHHAQANKTTPKARFALDLIKIDPHEPFYLKGPKQVVRILQISFVAIVSFLIWLTVVVAS